MAIQRLCVLSLAVAVQVFQLQEGRDDPNQEASVVFCQDQQQCLTELALALEGRTRKQQNPYPLYTLAWASWLIARLGR